LGHFTTYNEDELLQQLKTGSENAFTCLFDRYRGTVYGVALKFLRSPVLAEEIVQDVFLKLWLKRGDMDAVKRLDGYLFVMARNFIFDRIKKMAYESSGQSLLPLQESPADDSEYLVRKHQCEQLLQEAIALLPAQQKQVYILSKMNGLSHEKIAERMQLSRLTVKKHMAMALQSIRKYLDARLHQLLWPSLLGTLLLNG
jgi:RNA polymerase sigma-70 factor (family 1)